MVDVFHWLQLPDAPDAKIIMQVHDELVLEAAESDVARVKVELCQRMAAAASLKVPLLVQAGDGDNWDQAH